ncbi:MAG: phosphomethylpyrimidine synthase ThiC, partial [Methylococcales bacterium]|nr:phosphomethylpyrimidine synthase ThiC [Methylococcales bacterium]
SVMSINLQQDINTVQEVKENLVTAQEMANSVNNGTTVILKGHYRSVAAGEKALIKVNTHIGCSNVRGFRNELKKLETFANLGYRPDLMMDLSIIKLNRPLYEYMIETFGGPVGTVPYYSCYSARTGFDRQELLEEIEKQATSGVSWMVLHLGVRRDLHELAQQTRLTPMTARGGGILIQDMYLNNRNEGIVSELFPEILKIFKKHGVVLNIGSTFRPANVVDALDQVHVREMEMFGEYIEEAYKQDVPVIIGAILGHITLAKINRFVDLIRNKLKYMQPIETLGPIPTDAAVGEDHISNAIGAAYSAMLGCSCIINSITREEHTGRVPDLESIKEGLKAARIAAHSVNISKFPQLEGISSDNDVIKKRAFNHTCVVEGGLFSDSAQTRFSMGCTRCGRECPL